MIGGAGRSPLYIYFELALMSVVTLSCRKHYFNDDDDDDDIYIYIYIYI